MSYTPRSEILDLLDRCYDVRLISAEAMHDEDLQALWELIADLQGTITALQDERDELIETLNQAADEPDGL